MQSSNRFYSYFSFNLVGKYDTQIINKIVLINLSTLIISVLSLIQITKSIISHEYLQFAGAAICFIVLAGNYFFLKSTKKYISAAHSLLVTCGLFFAILIFNNSLIYLSLVVLFPMLSLFLHNIPKAIIYSSVYLAILLFLSFLGESITVLGTLDIAEKMFFVLGYCAVFICTYFFTSLQQNIYNSTERSMLESQKIVKERTEFISNMSYQIRTPLNNLMQITSLINKTELDERQQDYVDTIQASANNLFTVANSINKVSDVKIETPHTENLKFNLQLTVSSILELFSNQKIHGVNIQFTFSNKIPERLIGNPIIIKQILLNLIENFVKFKSEEELSLTIKVEPNKETERSLECVFEILSDKPINIPVKTSEAQYKSIIRKDKLNIDSQKHIELLDLTVTKDLIEMAGGTLMISTSPKGTSYIYTLPLLKTQQYKTKKELSLDEDNNVGVQLKPKEGKPSQAAKSIGEANVLLVEDNQINQKIMLLSLKNVVKNIDVANNGKEALDLFGTRKYDLILMDVQMPVMDGIKTTIKLREIETATGSHTPVIAITANALAGDKEQCISSGMDDYMAKPFQLSDLLEKMKDLLSRDDESE